MDDSEGKSSPEGVPKWQLNAPSDNADNAAAEASQSQQNSDTDKLEVARRFLDDDAVKTAPRDTKIDFLKSKGVEDEDIEHLLGGLEEAPSSAKDSTPSDVCKHIPIGALHLPIKLTPATGVQPESIASARKIICTETTTTRRSRTAETHPRRQRSASCSDISRVPHQAPAHTPLGHDRRAPQYPLCLWRLVGASIWREQVRRRADG